jgi:chromosome segregation ATPase
MPGSDLISTSSMNNRKQRIPKLACLVGALVLLTGSWLPDTLAASASGNNKDAKKERQALRRLQQQLNEIQQQKSAVDQANTVLEESLKKIHDETDSHKRSASSAAAKVHQLKKDIEAANSEKTELRSRLDEAGKQNEALSVQGRQLEQDLKDKIIALGKQGELKKLCETNNGELYRIGRELVDWYADKGPLNAILEAEPFTRMKSVEMENLLENYREKLEAQHLDRSINQSVQDHLPPSL